jgi:hypothetical protein
MSDDELLDHLGQITQGLSGLDKLRACQEVLAWVEQEMQAAIPEARAEGASWKELATVLASQSPSEPS